MARDEFDLILKRYLDGTCSPEEKALVENWFQTLGEDRPFELDDIRKESLRHQLWLKLQQRVLIQTPPASTTRTHFIRRSMRMAAAVLILAACGAWLYFLTGEEQHNTPIAFTRNGVAMLRIQNQGEQTECIALHDGSVIQLAPTSQLEYPKTFGEQREVYLSGEAFFNVAKDAAHPFLVYTGDVTTKVLGTSFNVKAFDHEQEIVVAVRTGRVSVKANTKAISQHNIAGTNEEVILTPNQQAVYNRQQEHVSTTLVEKPQVIGEPVQHMRYENAPVSEILQALEKSFGVDIQYNKQTMKHCTLTTEMTTEGLYERLDIICNALNAEYRVQDTAIIVTSAGCE